MRACVPACVRACVGACILIMICYFPCHRRQVYTVRDNRLLHFKSVYGYRQCEVNESVLIFKPAVGARILSMIPPNDSPAV